MIKRYTQLSEYLQKPIKKIQTHSPLATSAYKCCSRAAAATRIALSRIMSSSVKHPGNALCKSRGTGSDDASPLPLPVNLAIAFTQSVTARIPLSHRIRPLRIAIARRTSRRRKTHALPDPAAAATTSTSGGATEESPSSARSNVSHAVRFVTVKAISGVLTDSAE